VYDNDAPALIPPGIRDIVFCEHNVTSVTSENGLCKKNQFKLCIYKNSK